MKQILLLLVGITLVSCSRQVRLEPGTCRLEKAPGWLADKQNFQLRAYGRPSSSNAGFVRQRSEAKETALLCAQAGARPLSQSDKDFILLKAADIGSPVTNGIIKEEAYGPDGEAILVYSVRLK